MLMGQSATSSSAGWKYRLPEVGEKWLGLGEGKKKMEGEGKRKGGEEKEEEERQWKSEGGRESRKEVKESRREGSGEGNRGEKGAQVFLGHRGSCLMKRKLGGGLGIRDQALSKGYRG